MDGRASVPAHLCVTEYSLKNDGFAGGAGTEARPYIDLQAVGKKGK